MSFHISFTLSPSDLEFFRGVMQRARENCSGISEQQIIAKAKNLLEQVNHSETADFIRDHMSQLEILVGMILDEGWGLIEEDRERVLAALAYFSEPQDLIPDNTPGLGFLDDAIMIEIVCKALEHEIQAYREFLIFRNTESNQRGEGAAPLQRTDWLEQRRQQLHERMRRRREGQANANKTKSPFSLF
jgi:hypothetical protein